MDDIRKLGERWFKQSPNDSPTSRQSGSPTLIIPPRVIAAASLAQRIASLPPHQRLALPSSSPSNQEKGNNFYAGMSSFVAARSPGQAPEVIDPRLFQEDCDPVRLLLENLPSNSSLQYFGIESGKKLLQLDSVTEELSKQVMEHHEDMVAGMQLVTELEKDLQMVSFMCKESRRNLSLASQEVSRDLMVTETIRKKHALNDMLETLESLQEIIETKAELDAEVAQGNFAKALRICSDCFVMIAECSHLTAVQDLSNCMETWLNKTVLKVDELLLASCRKFQSHVFSQVVDAYAVLDDAPRLADKALKYFEQSAASETHDVLFLYFYQASIGEDPETVEKRSRLSYPELCLCIPPNYFRPFLHRTLDVLFDLLASYHTMMTWQHTVGGQIGMEGSIPEASVTESLGMFRHRRVASLSSVPRDVALNQPQALHRSRSTANSPLTSPRPQLPVPTSPLYGTENRGRRLSHPASPDNSNQGVSVPMTNGDATGVEGGGVRELPNGVHKSESGAETGPGAAVEEARVSEEPRGEGSPGTSMVEGEQGTPPDGNVQAGAADVEAEVALQIVDAIRAETTAVVRRKLEGSRKLFWEIIAKRVLFLLSSEAMVASSAHQFLQVVDMVNHFIMAGEAFSGTTEVGLRAKINKQCDNYFRSFHKQNLEVLRMMQERENWQPLPYTTLESMDLSGLYGNESELENESGIPSDINQVAYKGVVQRSFANWIAAGNPFSDFEREHGSGSSQYQSESETDASSAADTESTRGGLSRNTSFAGSETFDVRRVTSAKLLEDAGNNRTQVGQNGAARSVSTLRPNAFSLSANGVRRIASERSWRGDGALPDVEEAEVEDEDGADQGEGDSMVEQQAPGRSRRSGRGHARILDGKPVLTGSSIGLLRFMDKYARLMQSLQPIAPQIFKGLCQLFDLYFLAIFRIFGNREAFTVARIQNETPTTALLTRRLRETLVRISHDLEEFRVRTRQNSVASGGPSGANNAGAERDASNSLPTQIVGPGNLYGIRERCIAIESLKFLAAALMRAKPNFQFLLPPGVAATLDHFYTRTVEAVPDLTEHILKAQARLLMNVNGYAERIANVKWDTKEVGVAENNQFVGQLVGEYRVFAHRLAHAGVTKQVQEQLLYFGAEAIAEVLVEGFSRVKRCTNEGRALMSLDLQAVVMGLQAVSGKQPNMQYVENYIKAFYLPETEYLHWCRTHSEYTRSQIANMINLVATMNNWKRKSRIDLLEKIESGEM